METWRTFRLHWPEYLIEAVALGTFMLSAGTFTVLIEHPDFGIHGWVESALVRRILIGCAMGLTAIALIYSPWGRRSGAHMNPAVTLTFLWLGKIARLDAVVYIVAQFLGGLLGVCVAVAVFGDRFSAMPVNYVVTAPLGGTAPAFGLELLISCGLMATVLVLSNSARLMALTGVAAGALVALYISIEAPYSGMSMNPARSLASALPAKQLSGLWIYFLAPPLGMAIAALIYARGNRQLRCAKLYHAADQRCIHCGYQPEGQRP